MENKKAMELEAVRDMATVEAIQSELTDQFEAAVCIPHTHAIASLEPFKERPVRIKELVVLGNIADFCAYVSEHKSDVSRIFWRRAKNGGEREGGLAHVNAALDYHGNTDKEAELRPSWNTHHADTNLMFSDEYTVFNRAASGMRMPHAEFLEFVEDYGHLIVNPGDGELLDIVRDLKATKTVQFGAKRDLDSDDVELSFSKKTQAERGDIVMPARITAEFPILKGGNDIPVELRVKYTVDDSGHLFIGMAIIKHEVLLRTALDNAIAQIASETEVPMYEAA